jgi:hypothetical protein
VSYELSREETHNWERALLNEKGLQPVCQSWIDVMKTCSVGKFSLSIHWAGILINLGTPNSDILELVPRMLKCNVPIWFSWGSHTSLHAFDGGAFISQYCPSWREVDEALITRQIKINPMSMTNPIFSPTQSLIHPPSVDPFQALSSSQVVSSSACLTQILFLTLVYFTATIHNPIYGS